MDPDVEKAYLPLKTEFKKDIGFFGGCGVIVGLLMIWEYRAKELGLSKNPSWADNLFSDFMSINSFGLLFFGYLIFAFTETSIERFNFKFVWLSQMVTHVEQRLTQLASALISFMLGLSAFVLIYSIINLDSGGIKVIVLVAALEFFVVASFFGAVLDVAL